MAERGVQLQRETFSCSICLDLLKEPVALPCGHSYCMNCIQSYWDGEAEQKVHSCPQCRKTFQPRPVLMKNTMLAELVEELKKTGLQAAPADQYAAAEDVSCDVCTGRKLRASKSCLTCLVSFCEKHLQPHRDVAPLKKHKLVDPSEKIQEMVCSLHDEVMKMFCQTDKQCICYLCSVDEHSGHKMVSAAAERAERQKELEGTRGEISQKIHDREKEVKLLQQEMKAIDLSADQSVENSERIFTELIHLLQKISSDVVLKIRSQQEREVSRVKELQEKLEQEISELKRHDTELEDVSHTEDHTKFLLNYPAMPQLSESTGYQIRPLRYFEDVTAAVSEVGEKLQKFVGEKWTDILQSVSEVDVLLEQPEPKTRPGFLKYACELSLDPNTAHKYLKLSNEDRKATNMKNYQSYPSHPDRFMDNYQVLSRESLTERCYWEVELRGCRTGVAVSYKTISRAGGDDCEFGCNDKSWALYCFRSQCRIVHNNINTAVSDKRCSKVGVYLDHRAGVLSFYRISETMTLLHRVQTTFTQPLYAGLYAGLYVYDFPPSSAEICNLK